MPIFPGVSLGDIIVVCIIISFLFIIRGINTWYWKINEIVTLLKDIKENTKKKQENEKGNNLG